MPLMATTVETESPTCVGMNRLVKYGLLAVIAALGVNAVVRVTALGVFDIPPEFINGPFGPFSWLPIIMNTAVGAVGATVVYGLLTRYSKRPNRTFTILAGIVLLLSFTMFLSPGLSGAPSSVFITLAVMHVTTATAIVSVLRRATKPEVQ